MEKTDGSPFRVLIFGSGMVGKHAVDAATKLGNIERNNQHILDGGAGALLLTVGRNLRKNTAQLEKLFREADVLVDAAQRRDPSQPIIPNDWLAWLPEYAVVVDLATTHCRTVVSCYSWHEIHPEACMRHYAMQLEPLFQVLFSSGYDKLSLSGGYFERALYRAILKYWLDSEYYHPRPR